MKQILANPTALHLIMAVLGLLAVVTVAWLWFIVTQPAKWAQLVDKENDYWVEKGFVSVAASQWFRRFEKGLGQKLLIALVALLSGGGLIFLALHVPHHHR